MKDEKELAATDSALPALPDEKTIQEIYEANFGNSGLAPSFEMIHVPTGGGLAWTIPDDTEDGEMTKELLGVIIDHYRCRAYWPGDYDASKAGPPDCKSMDGITGSKYGKCKTCEFSQWGSGKEGEGQACKAMIRVYVLLKGHYSILPYLLTLPPTSAPEQGGYAGSLPTYASKLLGRMEKIHEVLTRVTLFRKEGGKYTYSKARFFKAGELTDGEKKTANLIQTKLAQAMREKPFEGEEAPQEEHRENGGTNPQPWDEG